MGRKIETQEDPAAKSPNQIHYLTDFIKRLVDYGDHEGKLQGDPNWDILTEEALDYIRRIEN